MTKTVTAVFNTRTETDAALQQLEREGYTQEDITMMVTKEAVKKHFGFEEGSKADEGALTGAAVGGVAGALYLGLMSAGTLFIPGLNLLSSGALVGALAGLGAGAVTGGVVGALVGAGIPEHEAKLYDQTIRAGGILVAVEAADDAEADRIKTILKGANAQNVTAMAA